MTDLADTHTPLAAIRESITDTLDVEGVEVRELDTLDADGLPVMEARIPATYPDADSFERQITTSWREGYLPTPRHRTMRYRDRTLVVVARVPRVSADEAPVAIRDWTAVHRFRDSRLVGTEPEPDPIDYRLWRGRLFTGKRTARKADGIMTAGGEWFPAAVDTRGRDTSPGWAVSEALSKYVGGFLVVGGEVWEPALEPHYEVVPSQDHVWVWSRTLTGHAAPYLVWSANEWEQAVACAREEAERADWPRKVVVEEPPLEVLIPEAVTLRVPCRESQQVRDARSALRCAAANYATAGGSDEGEAKAWAVLVQARAALSGLTEHMGSAAGEARPFETRPGRDGEPMQITH